MMNLSKPGRVKELENGIKFGNDEFMMIIGLLVCRTKPKGVADSIFQTVVLKDSREMFLHYFYNSLFGCHFGLRKTLNLVLKNYWWKDIAQQVEYWCLESECKGTEIPQLHYFRSGAVQSARRLCSSLIFNIQITLVCKVEDQIPTCQEGISVLTRNHLNLFYSTTK